MILKSLEWTNLICCFTNYSLPLNGLTSKSRMKAMSIVLLYIIAIQYIMDYSLEFHYIIILWDTKNICFDLKFHCLFPLQMFPSALQLKSHNCGSDVMICCRHCPRKFKSSSAHSKHMKSSHSSLTLKLDQSACRLCDYTFSSIYKYKVGGLMLLSPFFMIYENFENSVFQILFFYFSSL